MTRSRRPEDWNRDLERAKKAEGSFAEVLAADERVIDLEDHTASFDRLDFSFTYEGLPVFLDLKEKIRPTSSGLASLWPNVDPLNLFVLDETVYRRIVWHGGGGYLAIHDHPGNRWVYFGPWELTLGPRRRYQRREKKRVEFLKGKILLDLSCGAREGVSFSVDDLLVVVRNSRVEKEQVGAVSIGHLSLPTVG